MENNNYIPNQYEEDLKKLNNAIDRVKNYIILTKDDTKRKEKRKEISRLFSDFMEQNFPKGTNLADLISITSEIIGEHPGFAFDIIASFTEGFIREGKSLEIGNSISKIIKKDKIIEIDKTKSELWLVYNIASAFTQVYITFNPRLEDIGACISNIINTARIKSNKNLVTNIIAGFTQGCIFQNQNLGDIGARISKIINTEGIQNKSNKNLVTNIIAGFTQGCIFQNQNLEDIGARISKIIKNNREKNDQDLVNKIINGFVLGYLKQQPDDINNLTDEIYKIIKNNPEFALGISYGFTRGCFLRNQERTDIDSRIFQIIKNNSRISEIINTNKNLVSNIINGFTQGCIIKGRKLENIGKGISKIINTGGIQYNQNLVSNIISGFTQGCIFQNQNCVDIGTSIYNILDDKEIKGDLNLVYNIINTFVQDYLKLRPYNIEDIAEIFSKLLYIDFGTNKTKIKSKLESTLSSIENQYCTNTLINSNNKQLSEKDKQYQEDTDYNSPQPPRPSTNNSKNGKGTIRKSLTKASNSRKRSNSEGKNNSSPSKRQEQQDQQEDRTRY